MKNRLLWVGMLAFAAALLSSGSSAAGPTMVDVAQRLYRKATPESFDRQCKGAGAKLEVTGDRHSCEKPQLTTIVRFAEGEVTNATVFKKGLHKQVVSQIRRKLGAPDSVKTLGAMKMHFWFTKDASISVAFQSSAKSRSTMVSFRSPG